MHHFWWVIQPEEVRIAAIESEKNAIEAAALAENDYDAALKNAEDL